MAGLLLSAFFSGCSREGIIPESSVNIRFTSSVKGLYIDDDVIDIDLFLFHSLSLISHSKADGSSLSISVPKNIDLEWLLIANAPDDVAPEAFSRLSDNYSGHYVMVGKGHGQFSSDGTVFTALSRLMCRIEVDSVTPSEGLSRIYLENASSWTSYDLQAPLSGGWTDGEVSMDSVPGILYCYPNPSASTRLVVEYGSGDVYKADLPALVSNTIYKINEIRVISREQVELTVSVAPWGNNVVNADLKSE